MIAAEKNRRAVARSVFSDADRHERTKLRIRKYLHAKGNEEFNKLKMRGIAKAGYIKSSEVQKITGLRIGILRFLISRRAIEHTRLIFGSCYTIEQTACLMHAKIYSTIIRNDESMLDLKLMCKFLKENWPKWEARHAKYKYRRVSKKQKGVEGNGAGSSNKSI
jgi:hypothetical protein